MGFFDRLDTQTAQAEQQKQVTPEMMNQEINAIRANTGSYLQRYGYNIPDGMADPRQITQHLLRSGQVSVGKLQQVMRMLGRG